MDFLIDYSVREQSWSVFQPSRDLPLLLLARVSPCDGKRLRGCPAPPVPRLSPPSQIQHASLTLGEVLAGDRKAVSDYSIGFMESFDQRTLCTVELHQPELDALREAIEDLYYFEFVFGECLSSQSVSD